MCWEVQKTGGGRFRLRRLLAPRITNFFSDLEFAESRQAQQLDPLSIWTQITSGYVFYFSDGRFSAVTAA